MERHIQSLNLGNGWSNLTPDIENLDFVSIAQSKSNPDVIYAGTGEKSLSGDDNGSGIYKSNDGGATWSNISPKISGKVDPAFANIYRIIVDPSDYNTLIIATEYKYYCNSYLFKSTDGGNSFSMVYNVLDDQGECRAATQVVYSPSNFNIQYAAIKGGNVIKSTDKGSTWTQTSDYDGFQNGGFYSRNEIAVSYSDPNIIMGISQEDLGCLLSCLMCHMMLEIRGTTLKKVIRVTQNTLMIIG